MSIMMMWRCLVRKVYVFGVVLGWLLTACHSGAQQGQTTLLNVSYDVMRDFYKAYNPLFIKYYESKAGSAQISIRQSNGGSSKQALAVANGLQADVVTMNQVSDINVLVRKNLIQPDWAKNFANDSVPFSSVVVFLVRKNNPKHIYDWQDLIRSDVQVVLSNPKTSGNGRYAFLAAYGSVLRQNHGQAVIAKNYLFNLLQHVVALESGSRSATNTFVQRQMGDVLITFENEASMVAKELWQGQFELVYPSDSMIVDSPVAVVNAYTDKKHTTAVAKEYLQYLWSDAGQNLAAQFYLRPSNTTIVAQYAQRFPKVKAFRAAEVLGNWDTIMQTFFAPDGLFDQLYRRQT